MNYMCPEAFEDTGKGDVDPSTGKQTPVIKQGRASDVWSLGCILYQMTHGEAWEVFAAVEPLRAGERGWYCVVCRTSVRGVSCVVYIALVAQDP